MNWLKKTLRFGEKIKKLLKEDLQSLILKTAIGSLVVRDQCQKLT